jgi:hypothetical protein
LVYRLLWELRLFVVAKWEIKYLGLQFLLFLLRANYQLLMTSTLKKEYFVINLIKLLIQNSLL